MHRGGLRGFARGGAPTDKYLTHRPSKPTTRIGLLYVLPCSLSCNTSSDPQIPPHIAVTLMGSGEYWGQIDSALCGTEWQMTLVLFGSTALRKRAPSAEP